LGVYWDCWPAISMALRTQHPVNVFATRPICLGLKQNMDAGDSAVGPPPVLARSVRALVATAGPTWRRRGCRRSLSVTQRSHSMSSSTRSGCSRTRTRLASWLHWSMYAAIVKDFSFGGVMTEAGRQQCCSQTCMRAGFCVRAALDVQAMHCLTCALPCWGSRSSACLHVYIHGAGLVTSMHGASARACSVVHHSNAPSVRRVDFM